MYKEEPAVKNTAKGKNFQINQIKLEDEETHRMQEGIPNEHKNQATQTINPRSSQTGPPRFNGPRGNGLQQDLYNRQRQIDQRNFRNNGQRPPNMDIEQPTIPRQNFNFISRPARRMNFNNGFNPQRPEQPRPNLNDQDGKKQKLVDNKIANVSIGQCFKCGGNHSMFSQNCTKFNKPLAPEACRKCNIGVITKMTACTNSHNPKQ